MNTMTTAAEVAHEAAKQTEGIILEQLGDFIRRGLIELETGPMTMVQDPSQPYKLEMRQRVVLRLKDREYVEKLEKENATLKSIIKALQEVKV